MTLKWQTHYTHYTYSPWHLFYFPLLTVCFSELPSSCLCYRLSWHMIGIYICYFLFLLFFSFVFRGATNSNLFILILWGPITQLVFAWTIWKCYHGALQLPVTLKHALLHYRTIWNHIFTRRDKSSQQSPRHNTAVSVYVLKITWTTNMTKRL